MSVPEDYGGLGFSLFEETLVAEELAWGCSGMSTAIGVNGLAFSPILVAGSDEQKKEYGGRMADGELAGYCATEPEAGTSRYDASVAARSQVRQTSGFDPGAWVYSPVCRNTVRSPA